MFMNAKIELDMANKWALPEEAIVRYDNKQNVFIETGKNQYEMIEVQIGSTENGFTEILNAEQLKNKKNSYKWSLYFINGFEKYS